MYNGAAAEMQLRQLATNQVPNQFSLIRFTHLDLKGAIAASPEAKARLNHSLQSHLILRYGTPLRNGDLRIEFEQVPTQVLLDEVLALDAVVEFQNYRIGIDVTVNPNPDYLTRKREKLITLAPAYKALNLDRVCVLVIPSDLEVLTGRLVRQALRMCLSDSAYVQVIQR